MNRQITADHTRRLRNLRARARRYGVEITTLMRQIVDPTLGHIMIRGADDRYYGLGYTLTIAEAERIVTVEILRIRAGALKAIA